MGVPTCLLVRGRIVDRSCPWSGSAGAAAGRLTRGLLGQPPRAAFLPAALQRRHGLADLGRTGTRRPRRRRRPRSAGGRRRTPPPAIRPAAGQRGPPRRRVVPQLGRQAGLLDPAWQTLEVAVGP